ncbi:hypothetical protein C8R32_102284 [Nitrosospira sp. Nsp5]|uniref:Uncharacterized protein n=1 Tax=Nitrosospira multiformis TaxID=1231 RepID=A0ABY0TJZ4_9PROT|nr:MULTISPECIES: hypothetical protein [Nitrosospira]PTR10194.1 hypothetical protein C8R32_102284 [Nitrosospira sp. Nsp5]SDQ95432.1 hypothetical protein SAMN05216402_2973 [Nitrosospira multiformis]
MKNSEQLLKELHERSIKEDHEKRISTIITMMASLYDKSAAYTNIIMAVGYAGFFTVWSNMKVYMSAFDMRISSLCMLTSVVVFVMWEVTKMIYSARELHLLQDVLNAPAENFSSLLIAKQHQINVSHVCLMKAWPIMLFFTIFPALTATSILIFSFVMNL